MGQYRELLENLSYTIDKNELNAIIFKHKYKEISNKDNIITYSLKNDNKSIFTYDLKSKLITVTKQGWQLMNIKRGF